MTNDEAADLAQADSTESLSLKLGGLESRPRDFVVATPEAVFVGGKAEATIDGQTYRHTGDGTFTRYDLAPRVLEEAAANDHGAVDPDPTPVSSADMTHESASEPAAAPTPPPIPTPLPRTPGTAEPSAPSRVVSLEPDPVHVRGLMCQRDHLVHPEARMCPLCGDNMQNRSIVVNSDGTVGDMGPRPPLGVVILPDGRSYQLERTTIVGRAPEVHPDVVAGDADSIRVDDSELSRAHLRFVLDGWQVLVEDLGSTNGSWLGAGPGARQLVANTPLTLRSGADIYAGTSILNYQPTSAAQG